MALLQIYFDKDGKHKKTTFIPSDNYYEVSVNDNVLKDNAIFCYGFNTPPNLFTGERTCFDILNKVNLNSDIPNWITYDINTDDKPAEVKSEGYTTPSGYFQIRASRYNRTTTFGVLPQQKGGAYRQYSFYLTTGFHVGRKDIDDIKWIQEGYDYDSFLQITISQDSYSGQENIHNPYYCIKKDDILIEKKLEPEKEVDIFIYVKASGIEYSCNKLSLAIKQYSYNLDNPLSGGFNILNSQNIVDCYISELI